MNIEQIKHEIVAKVKNRLPEDTRERIDSLWGEDFFSIIKATLDCLEMEIRTHAVENKFVIERSLKFKDY